MNIKSHFSILNINIKSLIDKKEQTTKKIEYVRSYVKVWSLIMLKRDDINTINFIDCMCYAGVYRNGDCCTCIEVLNIFSELCEQYPTKKFRIFCNDIDSKRIEILKRIINSGIITKHPNLKIFLSNKDVNDYLDIVMKNKFLQGKEQIFARNTATILYVDPFDFGTVKIPKVSDILRKYYCELIFNFFISDFIRNISNDNGRISDCVGGTSITTKEDLISYMKSQLRVGSIKHLFAYQFKTMNNNELYQIVFATPSVRGLEKLKDALWEVFDGAEFHRNSNKPDQLTLFTNEDNKKENLYYYSKEAKNLVVKEFEGKTVKWDEIELFLIENTMLKESQIIKYVLKPLIETEEVEKHDLYRKSNYKADYYTFPFKEILNDTKNTDL